MDQARLELVNNLYYSGDYGQALKEAEVGLLASEKKLRRQVQFLNAKGTTLSRLGRTEEALESLKRALTLARGAGAQGEVAAAQNNIGDALRATGRFAEAREAFMAALKMDRARADKTGIAFGQTNRGITEALMGRDLEARRTLEEALALAQSIDSGLNQLKALATLAAMDLRMKGVEGAKAALTRANEGRTLARKKGLRVWLWRFELLVARAHQQEGKLGLARRAAERAREIVAAAPPRPGLVKGAARVWAPPGDVYDLLIDLAVARKDTRDVYKLMEEAPKRALKDRLARSLAQLAQTPRGAALEGVAKIDAALEAALAAGLRGSSKELRAEIERLKQARAGSVALLTAQAPGLSPWVVNLQTPLKAVQEVLRGSKATLLSFYATQKQVVVLRLDGEKVTLFHTPLTRVKLTKVIAGLRHDLTYYRPALARRARLYQWLLARPLQGVSTDKRLLLVTHGALAAVPYAALTSQGKA
ncbi:MAG: tetratricopeptide repeat protein, partial [Deltaproteobacteria bacterium]|nr:tetratricopeptide repeat protein [Deltaproteobacteria bacterium]